MPFITLSNITMDVDQIASVEFKDVPHIGMKKVETDVAQEPRTAHQKYLDFTAYVILKTGHAIQFSGLPAQLLHWYFSEAEGTNIEREQERTKKDETKRIRKTSGRA